MARGGTCAQSLDLRVPQKSIFAFLGPNGREDHHDQAAAGLLKTYQRERQIFGMDIIRASVDIRANIGYLPQMPVSTSTMTARQTLDYTAKFFYKGPQPRSPARG